MQLHIKWFYKLALLILPLTLLLTVVKAQSISFDTTNFNTSGYGRNSNIAGLFRVNGCLDSNNRFIMLLSDKYGNFSNNSVTIGIVYSTYATFVNGTIPDTVSAGLNYRIRIKATNPVAEATSPYFQIKDWGNLKAKTSPVSSARLLLTDYAYGYCSSPSLVQNLILIDSSTSGAAVKATLKNDFTNANVATYNYVAGATQSVQLDRFYYTYYTLVQKDGIVSTKAYALINSRNRITLGVDGEQTGCLPKELEFQIGIDGQFGGISENYPGSRYAVNWGDLNTTYYSYCQLMALNGLIKHNYFNTSCTLPNVSYNITVTILQPWLNAVVCDRPQVTTKAKISKSPISFFTLPDSACINTPVQAMNISDAGQQVFGEICLSTADYYWYVDGVLVKTITDMLPNQGNLTHIFTTPGKHYVRLVVDNHACIVKDTLDSICIEPKPIVRYSANGADTVSGCTPVTFNTTNQSNVGICNQFIHAFNLFDRSNGQRIVPSATTYSLDFSTGAATPKVNIVKDGDYYFVASLTNLCGVFYDTVAVRVLPKAAVLLPPTAKYCDSKTINFLTDNNHKPTYNSNVPNGIYTWSIVGGNFQYVNNTSASSKYPSVQFLSEATYTVSVNYNNGCTDSTTSQTITFYPKSSVQLSRNRDTICYADNLLPFTATIQPTVYDSLRWITTGTGSFLNATNASGNTYFLTSADRDSGSVNIILKVSPADPNTCPTVSDTLKVFIHQRNFAANASKDVCTQQTVNYNPTSSIVNSTYTWRAALVSGNATGFSNNGTGQITDVIINNSAVNDAIVKYDITPEANGCNGEPYAFLANVKPRPTMAASHLMDTICSGQKTGINFSSNVSGVSYTWNAVVLSGNVAGTTQQTQPLSVNYITDALSNTSSVTGKVVYTITVHNSGDCDGNTVVDTIYVKPGVSAANAGFDQRLCNTNQTTLAANTALAGNGNWEQVAGNAVNITNQLLPNTTVTGLAANETYTFIWKIKDASACPPSIDTMVIFNRALTTQASAGSDAIVCDLFDTTNNKIQLQALNNFRNYEQGVWSVIAKPSNAIAIIDSIQMPNANFTFNKQGNYLLQWKIVNDAVCTPTYDTVSIAVFYKPIAGAIAVSNTNLCAGSNAQINLLGSVGFIEKWMINTAPFADNIFQDSIVNTNTLQLVNMQDSVIVKAKLISFGASLGCTTEAETNSIILNISPRTVAGKTFGADTVCNGTNGGIITLNNFKGGIQRWEMSTNQGASWQPLIITANTISYSGLSQTTCYRAMVKSGVCNTLYSDTAIITVRGAVSNAIAGADMQLCNSGSATLTGNNIGNNEYANWYQIAGPSVARVLQPLTNATQVDSLELGVYTFVYKLFNNACPSSTDTVIIYNNPAVENNIDTSSLTVCFGTPITTIGSNGVGGNGLFTYQWQYSVNGINWIDITHADSATFVFTPDTTQLIRRKLVSSTCTSFGSPRALNVLRPIAGNAINGNQTICINATPTQLIGNTPTGGNSQYTYQWQYSLDSLNWATVSNALDKDLSNTTPLTQSTFYRRLVNTTFCPTQTANTSNPILVQVKEDAAAYLNLNKLIDCAPFIVDSSVINALSFTDRNGLHSWSINNTLHNTGNFIQPYTITNAGDSIRIKLLVQSPFGCKADSTEKVIHTYEKPNALFAINDSTGCGPLTVNFTNLTPDINKFTYLWDFDNGQEASIAQPGAITFLPNQLGVDKIYTVKLKAIYACDTVVYSKVIKVKGTPKVTFSPVATYGCSPFVVVLNNTTVGGNTYTWDFGDGQTFSDTSSGQIQHTYFTGVQDTISIKLYATNVCGLDSGRYDVVISPNTIRLDFAVNGTQISGCAPHQVRFINNSAGATAFHWDFGDGNVLNTSRNLDTITHTFLQAGNYNVRLRATNGCSDTTDVELIKAFAKPSVNFNMPTSICIGDTVRYQNLSDTVTNVLWSFGDNNTSTLLNPIHQYSSAGTYQVKLAAARQYAIGNTCSDSIVKPIVVISKLPTIILASDTVGTCAPFVVQFSNMAASNSNTTWQFGDGGVDTGNTVSHTYINNGLFVAKVNAVTNGGCIFEAIKTIKLEAPQGNWSYDNGIICGNKPVHFQAVANVVDSVRWHFGDGNTLVTTGTSVYHSFNRTGKFLPWAEIMNSRTGACNIILIGKDTITVNYMNAGFTQTIQKECGATKVQFTDTTRSFVSLSNWQWSFGNGATSTVKNPTYTYSGNSNQYAIEMMVTSAGGCVDTIRKQLPIIIFSKPDAAMVNDSIGCANQNITFTSVVNSTDSINKYAWSMGNNSFHITANVTTKYSNAGTYIAQLIVGTVNNCYDTVSKIIVVKPTPLVVANADRNICKGQASTLQVSGATNYIWTPLVDITNATTATPTIAPTVSRQYIVTGYNNGSTCYGTDTVNITVAQPIDVTVSNNDSICLGTSTRITATGAATYNWFPTNGLQQANQFSTVANPSFTTRYRVIGTDEYGCFKDTAFVTVAVGRQNTVDLGADKILAVGTQLPLTTKVTEGSIRNWVWGAATDLNCYDCALPIANVKKAVCYTVKATTAYGCTDTDTMCIKVFCESAQVFIPNAFTPDNDGQNDILMVRGSGIKLVKSFRVFNRWGQVVFERANFQANDPSAGWDGRVKGIPSGAEVFIYTCDVVCENDVPFTYKGNVALLK